MSCKLSSSKRNKRGSFWKGIHLSNSIVAFFSSALLAFGMYNIHAVSGVTEGGILGLTLLLENWFSISPSVSGFVLNMVCYALGAKLLGKCFIFYSIIASAAFSLTYGICEMFPPLFPAIANMPMTAAIVGAVFVGIGAGFCVRAGGAQGGDDALAMSVSHVTHIEIQKVYLLSDISVLVLSLTYIPWHRICYSLLTVLLSGQIIGWIQKIPTKDNVSALTGRAVEVND